MIFRYEIGDLIKANTNDINFLWTSVRNYTNYWDPDYDPTNIFNDTVA